MIYDIKGLDYGYMRT